MKQENGDEDVKNPQKVHDGNRIFYAGKFRKFAVKTNQENSRHSVVLGPNVDENHNKDENHIRNSVGSNVMNIDCEESRDSVKTRIWMLEEFRRVLVTKPPIRADMLAMKEMTRKYRCFEPTKVPGSIPAVKVGDEFYLRAELRIAGLHFQLIHGIDYTDMYPRTELIATSVVASELYGDDLRDNNVVFYRGDGGNFEDGCKKVKKGKDQIWTKGNVALKNSMMHKRVVRVIRGIKHESKKTVFVYDGLYKVVDYKRICGNSQLEFKLVRCSDQEPVIWSRYK